MQGESGQRENEDGEVKANAEHDAFDGTDGAEIWVSSSPRRRRPITTDRHVLATSRRSSSGNTRIRGYGSPPSRGRHQLIPPRHIHDVLQRLAALVAGDL